MHQQDYHLWRARQREWIHRAERTAAERREFIEQLRQRCRFQAHLPGRDLYGVPCPHGYGPHFASIVVDPQGHCSLSCPHGCFVLQPDNSVTCAALLAALT